MIRRPLRPLARILSARAEGKDPNLVEAEERAARLAERHRAERAKAETRLLLLGVVFILGFTTVAGRMALVSASVPVEPRGRRRREPIHAQRADIVDRNGARPRDQHRHRLALCPAAGDDRPARRGRRARARSSPTSTRTSSTPSSPTGGSSSGSSARSRPSSASCVHDLGEPGLLFGPREARLYPNGALAAHVLGGAGYGREGVDAAEVIGTAGVERVFDARLRDPAPVDQPLRLSIDLDAQTALEDVLAQGMTEMRAKGAVGILMEAKTGQIRALGEPARLRPEPPAAAADQRRSGRQPALQPRGAGPLRARLGVQALHGRRRARARADRAADPRRHQGRRCARAASPSATSTTTGRG